MFERFLLESVLTFAFVFCANCRFHLIHLISHFAQERAETLNQLLEERRKKLEELKGLNYSSNFIMVMDEKSHEAAAPIILKILFKLYLFNNLNVIRQYYSKHV